jgi:tRNA nucleotidyltransferase (CCA-adding enzyme)
VAERVWKETSRALMEKAPQVYFQVLHDCGALAVLFPEVAALDGVPQPPAYHPEVDTLKHLYLCLEQAAEKKIPLSSRYAVLCHDLGKGTSPAANWPHHHGHEARGAALARQMSARLTVPRELSELAQLTAEYHTHCHRALQLTPKTLLALFKALDTERRPQRLADFLQACQADAQGREGLADRPYPQAGFLQTLARAMRVDSKPLRDQGISDKKLGEALDRARLSQLKEAKQAWLAQHS